MTFVHFVTVSDKSPLPPFVKGGTENAPFRKGGRAERGGISLRHCANVVWFDLEQNAHGYHSLLAKQETKLALELTAWNGLVPLYPQSRHALAALAEHYKTKTQISSDVRYLRQAAAAYIQAAEIGLANGRIRYTRKLSDLLVQLGDKTALDAIFGSILAQPQDNDRDSYYLALVDYVGGLAQFGDGRAWNSLSPPYLLLIHSTTPSRRDNAISIVE